jgi:BirA family biotin operon repressor/biotin-[acetyl-CoA-carboxylase] ligase
VNVAVDIAALPEEAAAVAGSLGLSPDAVEATLDELLVTLQARLEQDRSSLLTALRQRDALLGRRVRWDRGEGVAYGIDEAGRLLVKPAGAADPVALEAGEVHLRPPAP